jgi:small subunit ribosomal protein S1
MAQDMHLAASESEPEVVAAQAQDSSIAEAIVPSGQSTQEGHTPEPQRRRRRRRARRVDLSQVQSGQQYRGRVVGLADFGAFVDVGLGRDGLIHISELGDGFVDKVSTVVAVGDEVTVWVKSVDENRNRISLTMVEPQGEPMTLEDLQPGMVLEGRVEGVVNFGAFVDVGAPVNGLVHISEMGEGYIRRPQSVVSPGDGVRVRVLEVDSDKRKISLTMKGFDAPEIEPEVDSTPSMTAMQFAWQQALAAREH